MAPPFETSMLATSVQLQFQDVQPCFILAFCFPECLYYPSSSTLRPSKADRLFLMSLCYCTATTLLSAEPGECDVCRNEVGRGQHMLIYLGAKFF